MLGKNKSFVAKKLGQCLSEYNESPINENSVELRDLAMLDVGKIKMT